MSLDHIPRRHAALLPLLLAPGLAAAQSGMIQGTATYRERIALPPGAVLEVELLDISRQGAPAERIAAASVPITKQVPIAFALAYDPARIQDRFTYAVRGEIRRDGQVLFRTDTIHPVLTRGAGDRVELRLVRAREAAAQSAPAPQDLVGPAWVAEDIGGRGAVDRARSEITFTPDGRVQGSGGCNRFAGSYTREGATLRIGQVAATMMACAPALSDQERRFFAALEAVRGWRVENGLLHLTDASGATVIRAAAQR
ncbi:YbaY family lipoprotein [Falsiroseomonas oryziterrae]|uniref:YbaY family lipoprotein n=1 Tax=Falsiroseomonas oryziterrae TaxID=2911368 RepID=UPI001F45E7DF|nr:YbaY family lipoprotein [Roseomonas sp. NPKOSM-4]